MEKKFIYFGFEIIESYENGSFGVSLVSPLDGELYPINWHTSGSFERCRREFEWLTFDGGETFRDALYEAIADGLGIPLEDVEMVADATGYDGSSDFGNYELLMDALDGYMIDELPSSDWACDDERLGWLTVDDGLIGAVPDYLTNYLDYESIGRDRRIRESGCYVSRGDKTYYVVA